MSSIFGVLSSIWNTVTGIPGDIVDFVRKLVDTLRQWAESAVNWLASAVVDALNEVGAALTWIATTGAQLFSSIVAWTSSKLDALGSWVGGLVNDVRNWATGLFDAVDRLLDKLASDLVAMGDSVITWTERNVLAPLGAAIEGAINWVTTTVIPYAERLVADLGRWAVDAWNAVEQVASGAWSLATRFWSDVYPVLQGAWHFLVFVATHPFNWWLIVAQDLTKIDPASWVGKITDASNSQGDAMEEVLAQWLSI